MMWDIQFIERHVDLGIVAVERYISSSIYLFIQKKSQRALRYPMDNCFRRFGIGTPREPQDMFHVYLNHTAGQNLVNFYLDTSRRAREAGKPMYMFETNTASCGGFPGISDSFAAAIWMLDYGMQLAWGNFSGVLLHVGGQNVNYNVSICGLRILGNYVLLNVIVCSLLHLHLHVCQTSVNGLSDRSTTLPLPWPKHLVRLVPLKSSTFSPTTLTY